MTQQPALFGQPAQTISATQRHDCQICKDTGRLAGSHIFCFCAKGKRMERQHRQADVIDQARTLSSGTIATLTGLNRYEDIDQIQARFVDFIATHTPHGWGCWQDAWDAFKEDENGNRCDRIRAQEL